MMDRVNSHGVGTYRCSWMPDKVGWWAWTPHGIVNGWADSEEEARRMGETAKPSQPLEPRGQG